jgi:ABC-type molybdenum transport system ATPase subunit/photorepair protein PhrA
MSVHQRSRLSSLQEEVEEGDELIKNQEEILDPSLEITLHQQDQKMLPSVPIRTIKCVFIGDNSAGKTSLLNSCTGYQMRGNYLSCLTLFTRHFTFFF